MKRGNEVTTSSEGLTRHLADLSTLSVCMKLSALPMRTMSVSPLRQPISILREACGAQPSVSGTHGRDQRLDEADTPEAHFFLFSAS